MCLIIRVSVHITVRFYIATRVHMGRVEIELNLSLCVWEGLCDRKEERKWFHKRNLKLKSLDEITRKQKIGQGNLFILS